MFASAPCLASAVAFFGATASAQMLIRNHCNVPVQVVQSHNGSLDYGPEGPEASVPGKRPTPWAIAPGADFNVPYLGNSESVSIKVSKGDVNKVSQMEYCASTEMQERFWDLSDIDGDGPGRRGSPFYNDHTALIPNGLGVGVETCKPVVCRGGQQCEDAYQYPHQGATRSCPIQTGTLVYELCLDEPKIKALEDQWLPGGARTNYGQPSGLKDHPSYEGHSYNNNHYRRHQTRGATPSSKPRPRHLRKHKHQGHMRRMKTSGATETAVK